MELGTSSYPIISVKKGTFADIKLEANEEILILYENFIN